jgi:anti-anti-sigma factor
MAFAESQCKAGMRLEKQKARRSRLLPGPGEKRMNLTIKDDEQDDRVVVSLGGQLDTLTAKSLETHLAGHIAAGRKRIVVDMRDLKYVSSYGLRVFLLTAKQLRSDRNAFVLCELTPEVQKIFKIAGFDKILTIRDRLEEALAIAS